MLGAVAVLAATGCGTSQKTATPPGSQSRFSLRRVVGPASAGAGCSTAVPVASPLPSRTAFLTLGGSPFGVAVTPDGRWALVDELGGNPAGSGATGFFPRLVRTTPVPQRAGGNAPRANAGRVVLLSATSPVPNLVRTIPVPHQAVGNSLTADGRYLLIADGGDGATVLSVRRVESGDPDPVLGTLTAGSGSGGGAIEVASSRDGRFAFVSLEDSDQLAVYNLKAALSDQFRKSAYVGSIPLELAPVGMAVSPDGRWLYATSEEGSGGEGTLSVISIEDAERDPAHAVVATVPAHCSPVRVVVSADGSTVWVTARESDQLLAFSASRLRSDPDHALIAAVRVGEAPVGLALVDQGRDVVVADSNRFGAPGAHAALTVVTAAAALEHRAAVIGSIPAGAFPREMALEPDGKILLVGNFASDQLEAVSVGSLP